MDAEDILADLRAQFGQGRVVLRPGGSSSRRLIVFFWLS